MSGVDLGSISLWGLVATVVLSTLMSASQGLGLSRMSMPFLLGTAFTAHRGRAEVAGFAVHFLNGWLFSLLYALVFEALGRATWWIGALLGLLHGLFVLVALLPILPSLHPRMASERHGPSPTPELEPPGFMALNYGRNTPLVTLAAHLVYGAILGIFYTLR